MSSRRTYSIIPNDEKQPPEPRLPDIPTFGEILATKRDIDTRAMPFWTTQDTRNAILSTLIPGAAAATAFAVFARDHSVTTWWSGIRKPNWAPEDVRVYSAVDLLTVSPLGYASYLVYKNGGGFDYNDTRLALGLYGANLALALATIPIVKNKNLGCMWKNTALIHLTAAGAAYAFYKIDKTAGLLLVPYALWTGFYAILAYSIDKENKPIKDLRAVRFEMSVYNKESRIGESEDVWDDTELIRMYEESISSTYKQLKAPAQSRTVTTKDGNVYNWTVGSQCMAPFEEEGETAWFPAVIEELDEKSTQVVVIFEGYGNMETVDIESLWQKTDSAEEVMDTNEKSATPQKIKVNCEAESTPDGPKKPKNVPMIPAIAPPPPLSVFSTALPNEVEALNSMLMSWYMSGYHTGYYQAITDLKRNS
ncbi:unnamed protein product [Caenorhabditis auriculariae]|uniref:Tudor domain-containing protein n=1 Tax=Caenorhabditis auriculariae TaxID=2777116 RepID=A0A8S1GMJ8_9PELO|nr:unnamed protein product [Caenorhabditis auriculariae]